MGKINRELSTQGKQPITDVDIELLGSEAQYGHRAAQLNTREVVIKLACRHPDKKVLVYFSQEIALASTGMPPGFTTLLGGRPTVYPVPRLYSGLIPRDCVSPEFSMNSRTESVPMYDLSKCEAGTKILVTAETTETTETTETSTADQSPATPTAQVVTEAGQTVPLGLLALTRSGDKGNHANIGVIARDSRYLPFLRTALTPAAISEYFAHTLDAASGHVTCYEWPGLNALNIVMHHCLGQGGIASLRSDPQGKAFGQQLLDFPIPITTPLAALLPEERRPPYES
jgi:hypothetical protein